MIRELFGLLTHATDRPCQVILSKDSPAFPAKEGTELIRSPWDNRQGLRRMFYQSFQMGHRYCQDAVLLTTDSKTPFFLPKSCVLMPLVTDLAVYRMPEVYQSSRALWWRLQYGYIRRRASFYLAISEFTKREIVDILGVPAEKIEVVPCACAERIKRAGDPAALAALREKYDLPERYVLFVGNSNPRKNLGRMIRAFAEMKERTGLDHRLVIAGEQGWRFDRDKALEGIRHREDIRFIGFVADEDMPALYTGAALFAFPTLYEGFGVPVLEAQRCGVPVMTSNVSALPETAGDGAIYADPYDVESMTAAMQRVLEDKALAAELVKKGYENAKRFSWQASAEKLNEVIERQIV